MDIRLLRVMKKQIILSFILLFLSTVFFAQEVRNYDGSSNNLANPHWGATFSQLFRLVPADYGDGISTPAGQSRMNPRQISNALFAQNSPFADPLGLSDYVWVFGQFIDHDITLTNNNNNEPAMIPVNFPDPHFNPGGALPFVAIPMSRSKGMPGTGTDIQNPREHANEITAFIDGSAVYGSDAYRANWLRTFVGGKLKTSAGNLLPYNTKNGEVNDEVDIDAPEMADDVGFATRLFVAGDVRANENVLLTSFHTVFVREHNRICDELVIQYPDWSDEQVYQRARKIVGGIMQAITYEEWLPAMGVHLPAYSGYDETVNPSIYNGFSGAAYRMGHTLLSGQIRMMDNEGTEHDPLSLRNAFFNPNALVENGGLDPFFKGMATQVQQNMDTKVVDDVRNFLFGAPGSGAGGLDLAAININRGRERGLPDLNSFRTALGLRPYTSFQEICDEPEVVQILSSIYTDVNDIDPWVGMLAETHMPGAILGETVMAFMHRQFSALRDGDRFYYENDPDLSAEEKAIIKSTKLSEVVMRNTGITLMQENVFEAMPHQEICGVFGPEASLQGTITNEFGFNILNVDVALSDENNVQLATTVADGFFTLDRIKTCQEFAVTLDKNDDYTNGVSTLDLVLILKHILGVELLNSPYKYIAADVNKSNAITTADLVEIRKVILGREATFSNNRSWRFVSADYNFEDDNPLDDDFQETFLINLAKDTDMNFVGIKVGDVNVNADRTSPDVGLLASESRSNESLVFAVEDMDLTAGETYAIPFQANSKTAIIGYQFTMNYDSKILDFQDFNSNTLTEANMSMKDGLILVSWNESEAVEPKDLEFALRFTAKADGRLSELLAIQSKPTVAEAYNNDLEIMDLALQFTQPEVTAYQLYQNQPNPFRGTTTIGFDLPENSSVVLKVFDVSGKQLYTTNGDFAKGYHTIDLNTENLNAIGILYYQLSTKFGTLTKKMMLVE